MDTDAKQIIAIIGLPGSGKTEVIEYLIKKLNCPKVYFGSVVMDEVKNRGLEVNEANERRVREELRAEHGMAAMAIKSVPNIEEKLANNNIVLVESLYSWEEFLILKEKFGDRLKMIAVYSSPATRISRLKNRPIRPLTAEEVRSRDYSQIENLHQAGPIAIANFTIINEGTMKELQGQVDEIIDKLIPNSKAQNPK